MTTHTFSTRIRHDSDAAFREWGLEFCTALTTVGLVQTADTGQIDWNTVARASANQDAGYAIFRFNDTAQSTNPIFLKFIFGTSGNSNGPRIYLRFGSGSDGSGNLTNDNGSNIFAGSSNAALTQDTVRTSYFCLHNGTLSVGFKLDASTAGYYTHSLIVMRTVDASGDATDDAFTVIGGVTAAATVAFQTRNKVLGNGTALLSNHSPFSGMYNSFKYTSSNVDENGDNLFNIPIHYTPRASLQTNIIGTAQLSSPPIPIGSTVQFTPVGATQRTYLSHGRAMGLVMYDTPNNVPIWYFLPWE